MLLAALVCCAAADARAQPALRLTERAARPGERVVVMGRGFPAGARVRLVLGGRLLKRSTAGPRRRVRIGFRVPSRPAGRYRLTLRAGHRVVRRSFRILAAGGPQLPAPAPPVPAAAPLPMPSTLVAAGDIACRPELLETAGECRHARTGTLVESLAPDAVAVLGDSQYQNGELANFLAAYEPTWGRFRPINASGAGQSRIRRRSPA